MVIRWNWPYRSRCPTLGVSYRWAQSWWLVTSKRNHPFLWPNNSGEWIIPKITQHVPVSKRLGWLLWLLLLLFPRTRCYRAPHHDFCYFTTCFNYFLPFSFRKKSWIFCGFILLLFCVVRGEGFGGGLGGWGGIITSCVFAWWYAKRSSSCSLADLAPWDETLRDLRLADLA